MKAVLMVLLSLAAVSAGAQASDTWKMIVNKKVIAKGKADNEEAAIKLESATISRLDGAVFILQYTQAVDGKGWNRTIELTDVSNNILGTVTLAAASGSASFPTALLKKHAASKTPLFIYTMSLPKDKKKAAVVRVRRILLGKVEWI